MIAQRQLQFLCVKTVRLGEATAVADVWEMFVGGFLFFCR